MAARDCVEWCQDLREDAVEQLDSELETAGSPTVTVMRRRCYRQLLTVLGRGRIRTDREWHLVTGVPGPSRGWLDLADNALSALKSPDP